MGEILTAKASSFPRCQIVAEGLREAVVGNASPVADDVVPDQAEAAPESEGGGFGQALEERGRQV